MWTGIYRKLGLAFVRFGAFFWNGLNDLAHALLVAGLTDKVCVFAKGAKVNCAIFVSVIVRGLGYPGVFGSKSEQMMKRRVRLGVYPVGLTILFVLFLILVFLFVSHQA